MIEFELTYMLFVAYLTKFYLRLDSVEQYDH
jgi:hypothetical protein